MIKFDIFNLNIFFKVTLSGVGDNNIGKSQHIKIKNFSKKYQKYYLEHFIDIKRILFL